MAQPLQRSAGVMSTQPCGHPEPTYEDRLLHAQESVRQWELADRLLSAQASLHRDRAEYYGFRLDIVGESVSYITLVEAYRAAEGILRQFADEARTEASDWKSAVRALKAKIAAEKAIDAVGGLQAIRDALA